MSPSSARSAPPRASRRRGLAALAFVAVAAAGPLVGPAQPAHAVTSFTVTTPSQATTATQLDVSGEIDWEGVNGDIELRGVSGGTHSCGTYAYFDVVWDCLTVPLALGDNTLTPYAIVQVSPGVFEETAGPTIVITRGGTDPVAITSPTGGSVLYGDFPVAGTGPALGSVSVIDTATTAVLCTATVALDGSWQCQATAPGAGATTLQADAAHVDNPTFVMSNATVGVTSHPAHPTISVTAGFGSLTASSTDTSGAPHSVSFHDVDDGDPTEYVLGPAVHSCAGSGAPTSSAVCSLGGLAPGLWLASASASSLQDVWLWVPSAPTLAAQVRADRSVSFSGVAGASEQVTVERLDGATMCTVTADGGGVWSCRVSPPTGTASYRAYAESVDFAADPGRMNAGVLAAYVRSQDGVSALSGVVSARVPPAPAPAPAVRPPLVWSFTVSGDAAGYLPGDEVTFFGSGLPEGTLFSAELHSTPVALGSVVTGANGVAELVTTIPDDAEPGAHEFVVTVTAPGEEPSTLTQAVTIRTPPAVVEELEEPESETEAVAGGPRDARANRADPAAATALSDALPRPERFLQHPILLVLGGGLALALLFLVALPTELLNAALAGNSGRFGRGFARLESLSERLRDGFLRVVRSRALATAILLLLVSLVFGFSDPAFGPDLASLRLVLALAIALFVLTYGVGWLTALIARRAWNAESLIEFQPSMLVFAILGVVLGRLLDFSPGFLLGVVVGLELVRATRRAALGVSLLQFALVVIIAIAAWLGYAALTAQPPDGFATALLVDTLAAVTIEGLTGAVVAILPLRFLDGREIWSASRPLWFAVFLVVAVAFALLVLPTAVEGTEVGDLGVWVAVFAGFAVLTLAVWWFFARSEAREERREHDTVVGAGRGDA